MAAFVPPLPVDGANVATEWGIDIHRRNYSPLSCIATGNIMSGLDGATTPETKLSIDTFSSGYNMLDIANDQLVIPAGGSGMWLVLASVLVNNLRGATGTGDGALIARMRMNINGSTQVEASEIAGMGGGSGWGQVMGIYALGDGQSIAVNILPPPGDPADYKLQRIYAVRIGNAYGNIVDPAMTEVEEVAVPIA
jgi:hypothetical protein